MNKCKLLFLLLACLLFQCEEKLSKHEVSFYYWKSRFVLSSEENAILKTARTKKLYVKYFDIKIDLTNHKVYPVASIQGKIDITTAIIPSMFIENEVFKYSDLEIENLASLVWKKIVAQNKNLQVDLIQEVHVDCDWTVTTKDQYFKFLIELGEVSGKEISSTIRLHQVKFRGQTGIPPVKRGVLMCYNMGVIQDPNEENSIFNLKTLKNFTGSVKSYPIPLDIALPLFEWSVVFRNNKFAFILNTQVLYNKTDVVQKTEKNEYTCVKSSRIGDKVLLKGDIIRRESVNDEDLKQSIRWFDDQLPNYEIIFYHLDKQIISSHGPFIRSIIN